MTSNHVAAAIKRPSEEEIRKVLMETSIYQMKSAKYSLILALNDLLPKRFRGIVPNFAEDWLQDEIAALQATCFTCPGAAHPRDEDCPELKPRRFV